jgi:type I restriction enzyme S subunit
MRLGDLIEVHKGKKPRSIVAEPTPGFRRLIQIDDLRPGASPKYCPNAADEVAAFETDVLIAWDGANAATSSFGLSGVIGSTLAVLRPRSPRVFTPYLGHFVRANEAYLRSRCKGATVPHLDGRVLEALEVPLPSLPEQRRIADILDKADALRRRRRAALAGLDTLTQAIFLDMFGDPAMNSNHWPMAQLQDVVRKGTIVTYGIVQAGDEFPGGVPYIRTGDIVKGQIAEVGLRHTDPAIAAKFRRSRVEAGDIVISIRATVGMTAVVPPELDGANLTQGTARIAPGEGTEGTYLLNFLRTTGTQKWLERQIKGVTFREITLSRLRELPVALPPIQLQREFARRALRVENLKVAQRVSLTALNALFGALQHRAFRGTLLS